MKCADLSGPLAASFPLVDGAHNFYPTLLRELARGMPVSRSVLAAALSCSDEKVSEFLGLAPSVEFDDAGCVVGAGLTLRETPHVFEVDGQRLYTWCALDALMFPALIGRTAHVISPCVSTGVPVRLFVAPDGVLDVEPQEAVVSLVLPDASPDIRSAFCIHVNFFASAMAAQSWLLDNPDGSVLSVEEAFRVGQELARRVFTGTPQQTGDHGTNIFDDASAARNTDALVRVVR